MIDQRPGRCPGFWATAVAPLALLLTVSGLRAGEKLLLNRYPQPAGRLVPGTCFGYFPTMWQPWAAACPGFGGGPGCGMPVVESVGPPVPTLPPPKPQPPEEKLATPPPPAPPAPPGPPPPPPAARRPSSPYNETPAWRTGG